MNILLLNQFFHPDSAATSQLLADFARHAAEQGHGVTVICGRSAYGGINDHELPGVKVIRVRNTPFSRNALGRLSSYISFLSGALWRGLRCRKPELILTLTTPPILPLVSFLIARVRGSRHFIWEMDVYPDIAVDLNTLNPRSWLTRVVGALLDLSRRRADGIVALGECMRVRLIRRGIPADRIRIAENWVDGREIYPLSLPESDRFTVLYSGNLGLAHDIDTIRTAIQHLRGDHRFHFFFGGGGAQRKALEAFCGKNGLTNVSFAGYRPRHELAVSFAACDIGLVTQKPATLGSVVPSKTYGLMAASRPILYIGPREATPARIISRFDCGWQIDPGDTGGLIALLEYLVSHPDEVREAGARGRQAFLRNYDLPIGVGRICKFLDFDSRDHLAELGAVAGTGR